MIIDSERKDPLHQEHFILAGLKAIWPGKLKLVLKHPQCGLKFV